MKSRKLVLIVHNIRSTNNVGAILRTADALGVSKVYLTGYSPYPKHTSDSRLPHLAERVNSQIKKTALGAEKSVNWAHDSNAPKLISKLRASGFEIIGLEQAKNSIDLVKIKVGSRVALVAGSEVNGIEPELLDLCDKITAIPMLGQKESLNVSAACAIALYHLRYIA